MALELEPSVCIPPSAMPTTLMSSDDEDILSPKNKRAIQKKKKIFSDDEDETGMEKSSPKSDNKSSSEDEIELDQVVANAKRRSRLVLADSSSSDEDDKEENIVPDEAKKDFGLRKIEKKSFDKLKKKNKKAITHSSDEEETMNIGHGSSDDEIDLKQKVSLEKMRAEFGADESSEDEVKSGRNSSMSNKSNDSQKKEVKTKGKKSMAPKRKSAVACRAAIDKERIKMISESQRMVRESMASLPYHKPKQRSLKEFLSARPRTSFELKGAKPTDVDITVVEKELQETEKLAEEFYRPESEEEEERLTPPPPVETNLVLLAPETTIIPETAVCTEESMETDSHFDSMQGPPKAADKDEPMDVDCAKKVLDFVELEEKLTELKESEDVETPLEEIIKEVEPTNIEASTFPKFEVSKSTLLLEALNDDACLTPSDAVPEKVFAVPAPPSELKCSVEDSLEEEIHLYFEDSEDPNEAVKVEEKVGGFDLQKIYDKELSDDEEVKTESPVKAVKSPEKKPMTRAQLMEKLKNSKPIKLQGSSHEFIDLSEPLETAPDGVEKLRQMFIRQTNTGKQKRLDPKKHGILNMLKAGEKLDHKVDLVSKPGTKMSQFKSELQESIAKQRVQEFNERQKEYKMYEDETDDLLGNDFDDDEKEEKDIDNFDPHLANETESEPEPDTEEYSDKPDKPRVKSAFVDEEAEESEPEIAEDQIEEEDEENEDSEEDDCDGDDENNEGDDESEDDPLTESTPLAKKSYSRIVRLVDSDDEEADGAVLKMEEKEFKEDESLKMDQSFVSNLNTSTNLSLLDSPGIRSSNPSVLNSRNELKMMGDLYGPTQPNKKGVHSSGITQMLEDGKADHLSSSYNDAETQNPSQPLSAENNDPQLNLNFDEESQRMDLADLCSGQFLTVPEKQTEAKPGGIEGLVQDVESQPADIADLCSGQFVTQPKGIQVSNLDSVVESQNLEDLCSGQFITPANINDVPKNFDKLLADAAESQTQDLAELCSGNFETQEEPTQYIKEDKIVSDTPARDIEPASKLAISSDDEEDNKENSKSQEKKKKRKKKRKLEYSDDEDEIEEEGEEEEEEGEDDNVEEGEREEDFSLVDYDSEENEVIVTKQDKEEKRRARKFFENEAELSGSDWGSADEDERELDEFEEELGDKEVFDEDNVKEQLGKIHARRMLDDDKRDVRLIQEAFLEDGDLHTEGGGRQRLFRWKNNDDGDMQTGCNPNLSGDEGLDNEEEDDADWRMMRLERETWLKEQASQEQIEGNTENSQLLNLGKNTMAKINTAKAKPIPEQKPTKPTVHSSTVKSPGKAILQALQGKSGSFFARSKISLSKVVAITGGDGDHRVSNSNKRNFVFTTISPSSIKSSNAEALDESFEEASPKLSRAMKRQAVKSNVDSNPRAKKHKVSNSIFKLL